MVTIKSPKPRPPRSSGCAKFPDPQTGKIECCNGIVLRSGGILTCYNPSSSGVQEPVPFFAGRPVRPRSTLHCPPGQRPSINGIACVPSSSQFTVPHTFVPPQPGHATNSTLPQCDPEDFPNCHLPSFARNQTLNI